MRSLAWRTLGAYAALGLPLAMALLPVYVHTPKFYAETLGVPLAIVGLVLFATRLFDALLDPVLGWWSDRVHARGGSRYVFVLAAVPFLALGVVGLFHPIKADATVTTVWLAICLLLTYIGFSMGAISYFSIGAELSEDYHERTKVTAARSVMGVIGVLIAAALPEVLAKEGLPGEGLRLFSVLFVPVLLVAAAVTIFATPRTHAPAQRSTNVSTAAHGVIGFTGLFAPLKNSRFRWLIAVFVVNGVASAIPATLILFFVQDVLMRADLNAMFLALYFVFGALGMPLWVFTAKRIGKKRAWLLGMMMSIAAFMWAFVLGAEDVFGFALVCALSGVAYGSELALPPSILADVVDHDERKNAARPDGAYFGLWQLTEKLNLAVAAGVALPLLYALGYLPGVQQPRMGDLSLMYAAVPCALKSLAVLLLWLAPLESWLGLNKPGLENR